MFSLSRTSFLNRAKFPFRLLPLITAFGASAGHVSPLAGSAAAEDIESPAPLAFSPFRFGRRNLLAIPFRFFIPFFISSPFSFFLPSSVLRPSPSTLNYQLSTVLFSSTPYN
jgi:hypothetical protein